MDKPIFDLLTELIVECDAIIANAETHCQLATRDKLEGLVAFNKGKIASYQTVAAWAREKLKASKPAGKTRPVHTGQQKYSALDYI